MSTITIKDVPPAVHRTLKSRAEAHGRSLNKEIIITLESMLHGSPIDATAIGKHARSVRETMGVYLTQRDLAVFKNTGRR
jgi:plasmid stability protein